MGPCKLYPIIKVEERYEDNIFELANDQKGTLVTTATPEFLLNFKCTGKDLLRFDYKYEILHYDNISNEDRANNKFSAAWEMYGKNYFFKLKEDFQQITAANTYAAYLIDYNLNDAAATLGADFDELSFEAKYENQNYDYSIIDNANSYNEGLYTLDGFYRFLPKTKALLEYTYGKIAYNNDSARNGKYNEFLTGLTGELAPKATGTVKFGYQWRNYQSIQNWKQPVTYMNIGYKISSKTSLNITLQRYAVESTFTTQNFYESNVAACNITQQLTAKTSAYLDIAYDYDRYPASTTATTRRIDNTWDTKLGLDIKTRRWFNLGASYEFRQRASNSAIFDYKDNVISAYLKAMY